MHSVGGNINNNNMKIDIKMICDKCGKEAVKDKKDSNKNWEVFKIDCACGGRFKIIVK